MTESTDSMFPVRAVVKWQEGSNRGTTAYRSHRTGSIRSVRGDFLQLKHTRDRYRDHRYRTLFNRKNYVAWQMQSKQTLLERARVIS